MKRSVTALILLTLALAYTTPAGAQGRIPRKWLVGGVGALIGGGMAAFYAAGNNRNIGGCSSSACVVGVTTFAAGFLGFLIGSEVDHLYNERYRHAPPLSVKGVELPLAVYGNDITVEQRTVLIAGDGGVEVVRSGPRLERVGFRARGLRGIGSLTSDSAQNELLVGTGMGLYQFPLWEDKTAGVLALAGEISAVSNGSRWSAMGMGPEFQIADRRDSLTLKGEPVEEDARVVDLAWDGPDLLWVLTEERLASYQVSDSGTAEFVGEFALPATGRRLDLSDTLVVLAAGSAGIYAIDIRDPAHPKEIANWSGARFAYDVTFHDGLAYIAAGPEGMYVARLGPEGFTPVGLARNMGFAAAVETDGNAVFVLDRTKGKLRRLDFPKTK